MASLEETTGRALMTIDTQEVEEEAQLLRVPLKEKKLMEVKLGELPSWILMRDFTPSGIAGAFRRGYDRYYNKYINVRKGSISGINMVLAAYVVFSYCISYKELKHERRRKYH